MFRILITVIVLNLISYFTKTTKANSNGDNLKNVSIANYSIVDTFPEKSVINFLKWYNKNEERLNQIQILTGGLQDTTTFYSVNFKTSETYLKELNKSGYLSEKFINDLRQYFIQTDKYLKQHPQNDGPAYGFEADLIMKSQDYSDVWTNLAKAKVIFKKTNNDKAIVKLLFIGNYKTKYSLTNIKNKWLIDSINNDFSNN